MNNIQASVFLYRLPISYAITGTGVVDTAHNKGFIYINPTNIYSISISDDNSNWSRVDTNLISRSPYGFFLSFIVPMEITDLIKSLNEHNKRSMNY
jgi:hypothetical protein